MSRSIVRFQAGIRYGEGLTMVVARRSGFITRAMTVLWRLLISNRQL